MYIHVKQEDCHEIVEKTLLGGEIIERLTYHQNGVSYPRQEDIPFYKKQHRVVLKSCGTSDAEDLEEYIAKGGYTAFEKALFDMTPESICKEITDSGLRGRGGGGFPAGRKWESVRRNVSDVKYIVCNGGEGDPGAFMDRSVMEGRHYGQRLLLPHPHQPGRRRVRLRRGQRPDRVHRGQAGHAPREAAPYRGSGAVGQAHGAEQRGNVCQRAGHYPPGRGVVSHHRHRGQRRNEDLRPDRQRGEHGAGGGSYGRDAAGVQR